MAIGGLDIGSSGSKLTVYRDDGAKLYTGYRDYPVARNAGSHEINARDIWDAVCLLLHDAAEAVPDLSAVGITSFGESFVLLDGNDQILLPTMLYTDPRGSVEAEELCGALGAETINDVTGVRSHPMYSLPKVLWIKKNMPEIFEKIARILLIQDYIVYMLTGCAQIDYSLASRTMAFDIRNLRWYSELFNTVGVPESWFSKPVPSGTSAGRVRSQIARSMGLQSEMEVVSCCHDQVAAAVGAGVLKPGTATDGTGTVECITPVFKGIPHNGTMQSNNFAIVPFIEKGTYVSYAFIYTGGAIIKWFVENLAGFESAIAAKKGISTYDQLEMQMKDEPTGILVLPHFAGAATPYMDTGSMGAIVGLSLATTAAELYRALMEGVCYEMALNLELLRGAGLPIEMLNATGGCAASAIWLQMKADILDVPVARMSVDEAGTIGGIILTGVAVNAFDSFETAVHTMVSSSELFYPRKKQHDAYMKHYERYKELYPRIRPLVLRQ